MSEAANRPQFVDRNTAPGTFSMSMTDPVRCNRLTSYLTEIQDTERICSNSRSFRFQPVWRSHLADRVGSGTAHPGGGIVAG